MKLAQIIALCKELPLDKRYFHRASNIDGSTERKVYYYSKDDGLILDTSNHLNMPAALDLYDLVADDWEIFKDK